MHVCVHTCTHTLFIKIYKERMISKKVWIPIGIQARKEKRCHNFFPLGDKKQEGCLFCWVWFWRQIEYSITSLFMYRVAENLALLLWRKRCSGILVLELHSDAYARHADWAFSARVVLLSLGECTGNSVLQWDPVSIKSSGVLPRIRRRFTLHL